MVDLEGFSHFLKKQGGEEPSLSALSELQSLFCIDSKYPSVLLANKMDKIISPEFDILYVNLLRGVKEGVTYYTSYITPVQSKAH